MKIALIPLLLFFLLINLILVAPAYATDLSVITFNVESGEDTESGKVAEDLQKILGADLWGLSEVADREAAKRFTEAVAYRGSNFASILGTTGGNDKLEIIYNQKRLKLLDRDELKNMGGTRSPLVAHFQLLADGTEFLFMVNHFDRIHAEKRDKQAKNLRQWAENQSLPILAVGDYNFDLNLKSGKGNHSFDTFLKNGTFQWIKPECWRKGTCPPTGTQCNPRYASILDFIFVTGVAKKWQGSSKILFLDDEGYCDWDKIGYSDHRPVKATFTISHH